MPIRVVAAVIERGGRLLVCERPAHKRHGGLWEFPGGKVEPGESDLEAVSRELGEELGVRTIGVGQVELSAGDPGSEFVIEFLPATIEGAPRPLEHTSLQWARPEALLALPLAPSDRHYVRWRLGLD
jgi:8-oxo-dGTP diphosphatase